MQRSEIVTEIRYLLDELTVANSHWGDTRLEAWIYDGMGDAAMRLPAFLLPNLAEIEKQTIYANQTEYTFNKERLRLDFIHAWKRDARIFDMKMWNALEDNEGYEPSTTYPAVMVWGNKIFLRPTPEPPSVSDALWIFYVRPPTDLSSPTSEPELPEFTHRWLVTYGAYKALLEDGDPRADKLWKEYESKFAPYLKQQ